MLTFLAVALLAGQTAVVPRDAGETSTDPLDKVICKRFADTGSLVAAHRECKTKRDWERDRENMRAQAGAIVNSCRGAATMDGCR